MASPEIESCLKDSNKEGVAAQVAGSVVEHYLVPLAVFLGSDTSMIGWLVAGPTLLAAAAQFFVVDLLRAVAHRRRLLVVGAALQGLLLLPVAVLPLLPKGGRAWALLIAIAAYKVVGGFMGPVWGSLMSEYLPGNERGRYFGSRSRLLGLSGMVLFVVFGAGLSLAGSGRGLAAVFAVGALARLLSVRWMRRMVDMPEHRAEAFVTRLDAMNLLRRLVRSNFVRFSLAVAGVTFATQLASAYFAVHALRDLGMGWFAYSAIRLAATAGGFASFPLWGRHADEVGNARVLKLTSLLSVLIPLPWIFCDGVAWLVAAELFSGAVWAGFNLCAANFVYDAVAPERRVRALGYFNVLSSLAVFAGAALGGWLAQSLPPLWGSSMHSLFALSAGLRLGAALLLLRLFEEVRADARPVSSVELFFSVVGMRPIVGRAEGLGRRATLPA